MSFSYMAILGGGGKIWLGNKQSKMHHDPTGLFYSGWLLGDGWVMTPAEVRPTALWISATQ